MSSGINVLTSSTKWLTCICIFHDDVIFVTETIYSCADQRKHQSSASLAFVRGIHRWPVNSPHKWPVTRKMFPFDDVIRNALLTQISRNLVPSVTYFAVVLKRLDNWNGCNGLAMWLMLSHKVHDTLQTPGCRHFFNGTLWISINVSLKFVRMRRVHSKSASFRQWFGTRGSSMTHRCVVGPQCINSLRPSDAYIRR